MKPILNWVIQQIGTVAKRSWENCKKTHKKALRKSEARWCLFVALLLLVIFSWALIPGEPKLGLSFLFAGLMAIYAGYTYKDERVMGYVLIGVILATGIPSLLPGLAESYKKADYIGMTILIFLGIFIWYFSSRLKMGEIPDFEERSVRKRRRPRR